MKQASYHRHDISDKVWALLEPHLSGQKGQWGGYENTSLNDIAERIGILLGTLERVSLLVSGKVEK